jgi:hypothetical protein
VAALQSACVGEKRRHQGKIWQRFAAKFEQARQGLENFRPSPLYIGQTSSVAVKSATAEDDFRRRV